MWIPELSDEFVIIWRISMCVFWFCLLNMSVFSCATEKSSKYRSSKWNPKRQSRSWQRLVSSNVKKSTEFGSFGIFLSKRMQPDFGVSSPVVRWWAGGSKVSVRFIPMSWPRDLCSLFFRFRFIRTFVWLESDPQPRHPTHFFTKCSLSSFRSTSDSLSSSFCQNHHFLFLIASVVNIWGR